MAALPVLSGRATALMGVPAPSVAELNSGEYGGGRAVGTGPGATPDEPVESRKKGRHLA